MTILIKLIADYAVWLYVALGLLAALFLRAYLVAHRERDNSIFALERESATGRMAQATISFLVVLILMGGVFYTSQKLVQEIPLPEITPTPTSLIVLPPSPTPPPLLPTPTPTDTPRPRPTPPPLVAETITPTVSASLGIPPNCPNPGIRISEPGSGATVAGVMRIVGSANIVDFWYYKF